MKPEFSKAFLKITEYQLSWKSIQWNPKCSVQTDADKKTVLVAFRNFVNAPKNRVLKLNGDFTH
jgi:hypothetical protein